MQSSSVLFNETSNYKAEKQERHHVTNDHENGEQKKKKNG
jgi:hypothetical protein